MSHQVLARKWRPGTFSEMVGQQHVLQALVNALESGRLHHAYLFTGTRGVGKTTVARILAKCLNCDTGITATPCGECGACAEIAEGRSVDLIEVDAASKTKVEDTRELLENVQYTPTRSRYKIYLIDEVHMLSNHSFNALLKTLEEPPPHALFLLATTDPQKLPATVLSRCLQFNLKNMQPEQIVAHLEQVLTAESVPSDPEALALIARAAEGSMRDALSLADQAIAYGEGKLTGALVAEMLGTVDRGKVLDLIAALLDDNAAEVLSLVAHIAEHAPDYVSTLDELSNALHQMTIAQTVPDAMDTSWPDQARIVELAAQATLDDTQLFWQMAVSGRREVHLASSARAGLEMILLRMIAFRPAAIIHLPTEPGDPPAKKPEPPATPVDSGAPKPSGLAPNSGEDTLAAQPEATHEPVAQAAEPGSSETDESGMVDANALTPGRWPEGFEMFHFTGILHNIALNLALIDSRGSALQFCIKEKDATLLNERHPAQLSQALSQQLGQSVTATITVSDHHGRTPSQCRAALAAARLAEAEQAISSDQALNGLIAAFDGHIIPGSIRPNLADGEAVTLQHDAD
ncbi:MAG: DNA polymerase III subunit gamma/tau [Luminiphilus sp.]|nr:DNA polymerase III subunit gamma/tau [Luminiphilus sp.]